MIDVGFNFGYKFPGFVLKIKILPINIFGKFNVFIAKIYNLRKNNGIFPKNLWLLKKPKFDSQFKFEVSRIIVSWITYNKIIFMKGLRRFISKTIVHTDTKAKRRTRKCSHSSIMSIAYAWIRTGMEAIIITLYYIILLNLKVIHGSRKNDSKLRSCFFSIK